jgi:hypothetical protein
MDHLYFTPPGKEVDELLVNAIDNGTRDMLVIKLLLALHFKSSKEDEQYERDSQQDDR